MTDWTRTLTLREQSTVDTARDNCFLLYEGQHTPHRSCGIALAETFGLPTRPYQALRRGGLTGAGECGAAMAGRLILGELLGDPDPTGAVTAVLRAAIHDYDALWPERTGSSNRARCQDLVSPFPDFGSPARRAFCTHLASETAALVAEILVRHGGTPELPEPDRRG